MKKLSQICDELVQQCARNKKKRDPKILCRINDKEKNDFFELQYAGGEIQLIAGDYPSAIYGINILQAGIASGHWPEFIGAWRSRFALRPLWIGCDRLVSLSSKLSIALPRSVFSKDKQSIENFCLRLLELGYNSVLLGQREQNVVAYEDPFDIADLIETFHKYEIKVIFKLSLKDEIADPINFKSTDLLIQDLKLLGQKIPTLDYIFWESLYTIEKLQHPILRDQTQEDLVRKEISLLETSLNKQTSLIYYIPVTDYQSSKQQAQWLPVVCDDVAMTTIISFSAVCGDPTLDYLEPHFFWKVLRQFPDISATAFMPIINLGSIRHGEGLWPALTLDIIDQYIGSCRRHHFAGVIGLINKLPQKGSILDCSLWVAAQIMWKEQPIEKLVETWFLAFRPELNYSKYAQALKDIRSLVISYSYLRSIPQGKSKVNSQQEEIRALAESMVARLKCLQLTFDQEAKSSSKHITFSDYFSYFSADMCRLMVNVLQTFNISLMHLRKDEDSSIGFWTTKDKRDMLDFPVCGQAEGRMLKIYDEARGEK